MSQNQWVFQPMSAEGVVEVGEYEDVTAEDLSVDHYAALREEAASAKRLAVSRNAATYYRGQALTTSFDPRRSITDEKMFKVSGLIDWVAGKPDVVVEALRRGRVRARVSAAMGLGKSTLLPTYIANAMEHRVLYVSLGANALEQCDNYLRSRGYGMMHAQLSSKVRAWVGCMTYDDFSVYAGMSKRAELFKHFETIIFDEAFVAAPAVKAALKQFAVLSLPDTNLLLCSANIREDAVGVDMKSVGAGRVKILENYLSPEDARKSRKLVTNYLTDRTLVVLPSDEQVADMYAYYESEGVDVRSLDTASRSEEVSAVESWLRGDSSTPRVLTVHTNYAIMYNFMVSYVLLWPVVEKFKVNGVDAYYEEVPMTGTLINQAMARAGRGMAEGAGGIVFGPGSGTESEMTVSEKFEEYVMLAQSYIKPRDTEEWREVHKIIPGGLAPDVARQLKKVNLPAEIAMRYLASDGRFAKKYIEGIMAFTQSGHFVYPSENEEPAHYDRWVEETVFGSCGGPPVRVPACATGELQVVLHTISAVSSGSITVEDYKLPSRTSNVYYESDEDRESTVSIQRRRLRRVRSSDRKLLSSPVVAEEDKWSYMIEGSRPRSGDRYLEDVGSNRRGVIIAGDRYRDAMSRMCQVVGKYVPENGDLRPVLTESGSGTCAQVEIPGSLESDVESPGGSVFCTVSGELAVSLNTGKMLTRDMLKELIQVYRVHKKKLILSKVFDAFGLPWTSVLLSMQDSFLVSSVVRSGLHSFAYEMLGDLYSRYAFELVAVMKNSNVFKRQFARVFVVTPTLFQVLGAMRKGNFRGVAQTEGFKDRCLQLKKWMDDCVMVAEVHGVFLPGMVTTMQSVLPLHASTAVGHLADGSMVGGMSSSGVSFDRRYRTGSSSRSEPTDFWKKYGF